jgi:hypothetical protein
VCGCSSKVDLSFIAFEFRLRGSRLNVADVKNLSRAATAFPFARVSRYNLKINGFIEHYLKGRLP